MLSSTASGRGADEVHREAAGTGTGIVDSRREHPVLDRPGPGPGSTGPPHAKSMPPTEEGYHHHPIG